jgi:hypothetical protein
MPIGPQTRSNLMKDEKRDLLTRLPQYLYRKKYVSPLLNLQNASNIRQREVHNENN